MGLVSGKRRQPLSRCRTLRHLSLQQHSSWFAQSLGLLDGHLVYPDHRCCPSGILYISFGGGLEELRYTISSLDVLPSSPSDKFDSTVVDFRRLPGDVFLAEFKFSMRAFEAFRFCGMAENEDVE